MKPRTVVSQALYLSLFAITVVVNPCIAVENPGPRPIWFNRYDLPEHAVQETINQDYPLDAVFTRFYKNLEISQEQGLQTIGTTIDFKVTPDGKITISRPRGNDTDKQVWFTFLDAATMASSIPVKITPKFKTWFDENGTRANLFFELQPKLKEATIGAKKIEQIHLLLPENKKDLVIIRAIPKQILESYPGLFTAEELDEISNFRTLDPAKASLQTIESLRKPWCEILSTTTEVSKKDIQKLREKIDSEFSSVISSIKPPT